MPIHTRYWVMFFLEAMIKKLQLLSVWINKDNTQVFPALYDLLCAN